MYTTVLQSTSSWQCSLTSLSKCVPPCYHSCFNCRYPTVLTLPDQRVIVYGGQVSGDGYEAGNQIAFTVIDTNTSTITSLPDTFLVKTNYPVLALLPYVPATAPPGTFAFLAYSGDKGNIVHITPDNQLINFKSSLPTYPFWFYNETFWLSQNSASGG
jgi:hypothetical protein